MTLPVDWQFPVGLENTGDDNTLPSSEKFKDLTFNVKQMYQKLAQGVNGNFRGSPLEESRKWTPTFAGTTNAGNFTYNHQTGWVYRQGLLVDIWFDVYWSTLGGATGNLYLNLPYKVAKSNNVPFVGVIQQSNIVLTAGNSLVINAIPDTYRGEIWCKGGSTTTAVVTKRQAVKSTVQLIGHIRYIGQYDA
ncbi:MAG: hypothetical protein R3230_01185 [Nitrosopumilaceae archaeon]|nr:hypothetical protein [Nitrosopumilaceae archaeon]